MRNVVVPVSEASVWIPGGRRRLSDRGRTFRDGRMTAEQVVATEEWIRDKAQLSNVRSDDVETLSLHGSYHEKIVTLGDSLLNFKRLKSLDLSRNAIVSLEGLECLQELEKLSLYFNNIQSLEEISSLRHLIYLTELDLRLNPVTSTEKNYRQYVIQLLPNLQKLDLRPVRETERNPAKFDFISQEQYERSEVDKREDSQRMQKVFSYDTDELNCVNRAGMCKWDGASNNQSELRSAHATEKNASKFEFISQEQCEMSEVDKMAESQQMKKVFSYDPDQNYVNRAQMCKWDGASNNQSDVKTNTKFRSCRSIDEDDSTSIYRSRMLSTSQIPHNGTSSIHGLVDRQQLLSRSNSLTSLRPTCSKRSFTDRKETGHLRSEQNQIPPSEDLIPVCATERNRAKFDFISHEQYETSEVDKKEESQQMKKDFSHDTDEQSHVNRTQMCKWDGASHNQSDLRPVHGTERNPEKFDFISQEQFETAEVDKREESQQMKKDFSYDTDEQNYVNRAQMCKWDGASHNQSDTNTKYRSCRSIDEDGGASIDRSGMLSSSQIPHNGASSAHGLVDRQQLLSPSNSLTSLRPTCSKRSFTDRKETEHLRSEQNQIPPSEDVKTTTKYRSCRSINEDVSSSIHRSRILSASQIPHNEASSAHGLVDQQQLLSPSNSLTSLHTTCSKRSFTDRKDAARLRSEQNQIPPSEDHHRNYQSPVRSSFCSVGKNVCNQSRERLRVTFADQVPIKSNKLSSGSIPKEFIASCLKLRMPSTSQMPHQETTSCDQQNRASASFTEHINTEIPGNKSSERQSKLTRGHTEYIDERLEATKTSSLNSLQPSYHGKATRHKLPEVDQCGDYNPQIPFGLRSGSSANISQHLQNLLNLVDRHWSGSNSLHRNQRFLNSAEELLLNALDTMAISNIQSLEQKVKVLTEENRSLLTRTASGLDSATFLGIKHEFTQKEDDLESLNGKFEKLIEENNKLHSQLRSLKFVNSAGLQQRNEELHKENDRLNLQVKYLNQQIKQHNKLKDTLTMLQESQRAIISSNIYLQELLNARSTGQRTDKPNVLSKGLGPKC